MSVSGFEFVNFRVENWTGLIQDKGLHFRDMCDVFVIVIVIVSSGIGIATSYYYVRFCASLPAGS